MTVREAWLSDVDDIAPLFNAYRVFYDQPSDLAGAQAWIRDNMTLKRATLFVCQENDVLLGFTQLYPAFCSVEMKPFYVLYDVYVDPKSRQRGVASMLLRHAHAWAKTQGATRVDLETAHTNTTAQSVYEALGYALDSEFRKYSFDTSSL
jgi:ribosomal protein S18 acetylase RimI-like enzyme